jgi:hypothetical protein
MHGVQGPASVSTAGWIVLVASAVLGAALMWALSDR